MITINIRLVGLFKTGRFRQDVSSWPETTLVGDVVAKLQIPLKLLGIILINGIHADIDTRLKDGDILVLLPLLEGG